MSSRQNAMEAKDILIHILSANEVYEKKKKVNSFSSLSAAKTSFSVNIVKHPFTAQDSLVTRESKVDAEKTYCQTFVRKTIIFFLCQICIISAVISYSYMKLLFLIYYIVTPTK